MEKLKHKLKGHGGFTLVEMLVVVAIIAILVAVSIPVISGALERTKHATDAANERAAKAEILIQHLADSDGKPVIKPNTVYYYNAKDGVVVESYDAAGKAYGKHTTAAADRTKCVIALMVDADGKVTMGWVNAKVADGSGGAAPTITSIGTLCSDAEKVDHTTTPTTP